MRVCYECVVLNLTAFNVMFYSSVTILSASRPASRKMSRKRVDRLCDVLRMKLHVQYVLSSVCVCTVHSFLMQNDFYCILCLSQEKVFSRKREELREYAKKAVKQMEKLV